MKSVIIIILAAMLTFGCKKDPVLETFQSTGVITGEDLRYCLCCGGLLINIDTDSLGYTNSTYQINELPADFIIPKDTRFPIYVALNWQKETAKYCNGILITRMVKRK
jgi:hypothetical protein